MMHDKALDLGYVWIKYHRGGSARNLSIVTDLLPILRVEWNCGESQYNTIQRAVFPRIGSRPRLLVRRNS